MGLIADLQTVASNGPSSVTTANSIAPAGPITDYPGMIQNLILELQEVKVKINGVAGTAGILALTDQSSDGPNYTLISTVLAAL